MTLFWLGTHKPEWTQRTDVPLFLSYRQLRLRRRPFKPALGPIAIDSGGFKEIEANGTWTITPREYVADVRRFRDELGRVSWCAVQDWMCEPHILQRTGLSVEQHQRRTIDSLLALRHIAPEVPWTPVIQGWHMDDYRRHVDLYLAAGVDLTHEPIVGLGSICRRQRTSFLVELLPHLRGIRLHGFGVKITSLARGDAFVSADSMAWSYRARKRKDRIPGHTHMNCANCLEYALNWRADLLSRVPLPPVVPEPARPTTARIFQ